MNENVKTLSLAGTTLVFNEEENEQLFRIDGIVVLPVGAEIELMNPNVNAVVTRVRLLAGNQTVPVMVCLDVKVPKR